MRFPNLTGIDLVSLQGREQYFYHSKICFTGENKSFKITVLKAKWKKIVTITSEHFSTGLTLFLCGFSATLFGPPEQWMSESWMLE